MKSKLLLLFLCILLLTGCGPNYSDAIELSGPPQETDYFTIIKQWDDFNATYRIVYANDTKVKYLITFSYYKYGITPLYNADGSLQIYDSSKDNLICNQCSYEFTNISDKYCPSCGEIR